MARIVRFYNRVIGYKPAVQGLDPFKTRKNFAEATSGASILYASKGVVNKKAILEGNPDVYLHLPECSSASEEHVIINLSDDVLVESLLVSNQEDFSSSLAQIRVEGSIDYPSESWLDLGTIHAPETLLNSQVTTMVRYLKLTMKGPENLDAFYCTLTSVKVFGKGLHLVMRNSLMDLTNEDRPE